MERTAIFDSGKKTNYEILVLKISSFINSFIGSKLTEINWEPPTFNFWSLTSGYVIKSVMLLQYMSKYIKFSNGIVNKLLILQSYKISTNKDDKWVVSNFVMEEQAKFKYKQ